MQHVVRQLFSYPAIRRITSFIIAALFFSLSAASQNNMLVINGAYLNMNGGQSASPIYLVVNQSSTSGIVRNSGHIHSEGQYNIVKWNSGTGTGNYVFPFGVAGNASDYIPFTFKKTTSGNTTIGVSTWATNQQNMPHPAAGNVAAVNAMKGITDSVKSAIDRFWDIQSPSPVTADLTFSYRGIENTTLSPADTFKTQHWNGTSWDSQAGPGNKGVIAGIGTVGPVTGRTTFSPWVLTRAALKANIIFSQNLTCNGQCTGVAAARPIGGTPPYTYSWSPNVGTTDTVKGLCAGKYYITVKDAANSIVMDSVIIAEPSAITATTASTPMTCGLNTGTASVTASGGTGALTYLWSPSGQTTSTITGLASGTYTVAVKDLNNCTVTRTVTVGASNALLISTSATSTGCTVNNGTASATPNNGTAPYTYAWSNGQTTSTATGLGAGTYTVTITDASGCAQTTTVVITKASGPTAVVTSADYSIVLGERTQLNALGGGSYSWSPSAGLSCTSCSDPVATPEATTEYCVLITDANGCTDSACLTIEVEIPCDELFVPSAFSPNNDGHNDQVCLRGNCIQTFYFAMYNRWGEKVFETTDQSLCWDGTYKGKPENTGVFVYTLDALLSSGIKVSRKGTISLIR